MFTNSDKGNSTVCMYKSEYNSKMEELLSDECTYIKILKNPLKKLQTETQKILKHLNDNNFLKYNYHNNQLTCTDTLLAKAYGLPKIHKENTPLRPIISLVNSPTHFLAKVIYDELKEAIILPKSHINNSIDLKNRVEKLTIDSDCTLLSLDVSSLFTNIPYELVKASLERRISQIHNKCRIPFHEIIQAVEFLYNNTYFSFNNNFYKQTRGTPMGSPISPLFADIVMDDLEKECLQILKEKCGCEPIFYYRYVDDTSMCIRNDHINIVLETFNSYHPNLQFTYEIETNNSINFLDLTLIKSQNHIITNWYQKSTSSGRIMNFSSNHPIQLKKNIVFNLIDRAILLSDKKFHQQNIKKVTQILVENNYPLSFIEKNIKSRLSKYKNNNSSNEKIGNTENTINEKNTKIFISLPYSSNYKKLSAILRSHNIHTIPKIDKSLSHLIQLGKDKTKKWEKTNVVYEFRCKSCPAKYIGETKRTLKTRINEHKLLKNSESVVSLHIINNKHDFDWKNTKILDSEKNYFKRLISEMINIKANSNCINKKEDVLKLNHIYSPLTKHMYKGN